METYGLSVDVMTTITAVPSKKGVTFQANY